MVNYDNVFWIWKKMVLHYVDQSKLCYSKVDLLVNIL